MTIKIATYNAPHRLAPHGADFQRLADAGVDIICAQEHADADNWSPRGWQRWRPAVAQSTTIYWNPRRVTAGARGHAVMSSPGFHEHRGLTWVQFKTPDGPLRVASMHPPAFKTSRPSHAREYRAQEKRMAAWLETGLDRVLAGDLNGSLPSKIWTPTLTKIGRWSRAMRSGPGGKTLDWVILNSRSRWKITSTRLGEKGRSDHRPVIVTLERS